MYFDWDNPAFLAALQGRIDAKNRAWKGGPYERRVLVIHTDEFFLDRETVGRFLEGATFRTQLLTDVFFGLSYHPDHGIPAFCLSLTCVKPANSTRED